jgi:hypothetical protein
VRREAAGTLSDVEARHPCYRGMGNNGPFDSQEPLKPTPAVRSTAFDVPAAASDGRGASGSNTVDVVHSGVSGVAVGGASRANVAAMRDALALEFSPKETGSHSSGGSQVTSRPAATTTTTTQRAAAASLRTRRNEEAPGAESSESNPFRAVAAAAAAAAAATTAAANRGSVPS